MPPAGVTPGEACVRWYICVVMRERVLVFGPPSDVASGDALSIVLDVRPPSDFASGDASWLLLDFERAPRPTMPLCHPTVALCLSIPLQVEQRYALSIRFRG